MPMLIWVAGLSGYMHKGIVPEEILDPLKHDPAELDRRIKQQKTFGEKDYEGLLSDVASQKEREREEQEELGRQRELAAAQAAQKLLDAALEQIRSRPVSAANIILPDPNRLAHIKPMIAPPQYDDDEEAIALLLLH